MRTFKLTYFEAKARGETARMIFKLVGQEFEDIRISLEDWPEFKKNTPMNQLPLLQVDGGVTIIQSNAFNRYLANEFGFTGKTNIEKARVDMIIDCIEDTMSKADKVFYMEENDEKAAMCKKIIKEHVEPLFELLTKLLESNKGGNGFFVGDSLTIADLQFLNMGEVICRLVQDETLVDRYPKLKALKEKIISIPEIKKWISERPDTEY